MTYGVAAPRDFSPYNRGRLSRKASSHTVSGAGALALSMVVGAWLFYARPVDTANMDHRPTVEPAVVFVPHPKPSFSAAVPQADQSANADAAPASAPTSNESASNAEPASESLADSNGYVALLDPTYSLGSTPLPLDRSAPLQSAFEPGAGAEGNAPVKAVAVLPPERPATPTVAQNTPLPPSPPSSELAETVPLPPLRPVSLEPPRGHEVAHASTRQVTQQASAAVEPPPAQHRSFFQKLFGERTPTPGLAYASTEEGAIGGNRGIASATPGLYDRSTAIYDISAHTVYLPDGTRLEAHSGLGSWIDDPHHVNAKMRGATPPAVYDLQLREKLFHGVQALRLIPVGNEHIYGRNGLLAHTFMLGPSGQSNGCVSFRNYKAFLHAYESGKIKRLVVVARLN